MQGRSDYNRGFAERVGWGCPLVYTPRMLAIFLAYEPIIYPDIYTHACFLVSDPSSCTHTLLDKPTMLVQWWWWWWWWWYMGLLTEPQLCDFRQTVWLSIGIASITETTSHPECRKLSRFCQLPSVNQHTYRIHISCLWDVYELTRIFGTVRDTFQKFWSGIKFI